MRDMMHEKRELFMSIHLNTKMQIESKQIISIGSLDSAPVHPREVFSPAVRRSAGSVAFVHNHPSGDPEPSAADINSTRRLVEVGELLGIPVIDHIIIGDGSYVSMKGLGYIT